MVAVSTGAREEIEMELASLGTNVIHIHPGASSTRGRSEGAGTERAFSESDLAAILMRIPEVIAASGSIAAHTRLVGRNGNWKTIVEGVNSDYLRIRDWSVETGRNFTDREDRSGLRVILLGATVARNLFPSSSPLGQVIRLGKAQFEVVGVLSEKGQGTSGRDLDDTALIPLRSARSYLPVGRRLIPHEAGSLSLKWQASVDPGQLRSKIEHAVRVVRHIPKGAEDDFVVRDLSEFLRARNDTQATLGLLLAATALITLCVGGIGILNVMLVSVSERTSEIGLRVSVGAQPIHIVAQFITEAIVLCLLGSLFGLVIGKLGTLLLNELVDWDVKMSYEIALVSIVAATLTALIFGLYPAYRASQLSPLAAMQKS